MALVGRRRGAARAHHEPGVGFLARDQPRWRDGRLRQQARRRHCAAALPDVARRWRARTPDERADRRRAADVVPRRQADRVPQPRVERSRHDGQAGRAAQGARRRQDHGAGVGRRAHLLLGHLDRRSPAARDERLRDRRRAFEPHSRYGLRAAAHGRATRLSALRHRARRQGARFRRGLQPGRERRQPRRVHGPGRRQGGREPHVDQQGLGHRAALQPRRSLARLGPAAHRGFLR